MSDWTDEAPHYPAGSDPAPETVLRLELSTPVTTDDTQATTGS